MNNDELMEAFDLAEDTTQLDDLRSGADNCHDFHAKVLSEFSSTLLLEFRKHSESVLRSGQPRWEGRFRGRNRRANSRILHRHTQVRHSMVADVMDKTLNAIRSRVLSCNPSPH